jgi:hypothetical protein
MSDWNSPQGYPGESILTMPYRVRPTGATLNGPVHLYGYSLPINSTKIVKSLALPKNRDIVLLSIILVP